MKGSRWSPERRMYGVLPHLASPKVKMKGVCLPFKVCRSMGWRTILKGNEDAHEYPIAPWELSKTLNIQFKLMEQTFNLFWFRGIETPFHDLF